MAMSLCVGCSSKKEGSKETTTATTEAKMKVQSKYKVPKITAAKKTDQLAEAQKGETIVTMQVKGYGEMKFKFFMKKAPLAVKNFVTLASNGYFDGQIFHRVINDFIVQAKSDTAKKGLEEGTMDFTKKQKQLFLDQGGYPSLTGSYTVFGQMIEGYDVLDKIAACETKDSGSGEQSQPVKKVVIEKMAVSNAK